MNKCGARHQAKLALIFRKPDKCWRSSFCGLYHRMNFAVTNVLAIEPILGSQPLPWTPEGVFRNRYFVEENADLCGFTKTQKRYGAVEVETGKRS